MLTQKDIHNFIVEHMTDQQKIYLAIRCSNDPKKIKETEKTVAKVCNVICGAGFEYLNTKI